MTTNTNKNRNRQGGSDNNGQSTSSVVGGELANGRLSQFKNHHPYGEQVPNEYVTQKDE